MIKRPRIRLSQCVITYNDEDYISQALTWGKGVVCEQIVVDTGSKDHTCESARAMGAQVFSFKGAEDMPAAENYAIEKAQGDWIAFLESAEYIREDDARTLLRLLERARKKGCAALSAELVYVDEDGRVSGPGGADSLCGADSFGGADSLCGEDSLGGADSSGSRVCIFRNVPGLRCLGGIPAGLRIHGQPLKESDLFHAEDEITIFHRISGPQAEHEQTGHEQAGREQAEHEKVTGDTPDSMEPLALDWFRKGNTRQCVLCCTDILRTYPYNMRVLVMMFSALKQFEEQSKEHVSAEAAFSLGKLYDLNSLRDRFFVLRSAMEAEYQGMIKIMRGTLSQEERAAFDQAVER